VAKLSFPPTEQFIHGISLHPFLENNNTYVNRRTGIVTSCALIRRSNADTRLSATSVTEIVILSSWGGGVGGRCQEKIGNLAILCKVVYLLQ